MSESFGIHWFRRDLRIAGNAALEWNCEITKGRTLGVFFFDTSFLSRSDFSHNRFGFFLKTLEALQVELKEVGGDLLVLNIGPDEGFELIFSRLNRLPNYVTFNRDYEPFARARDERISHKLEREGIKVHTARDHLLFEPHEIAKDSKEPSFFKVFTPFFKCWQKTLLTEFRTRLTTQLDALKYLEEKRLAKKTAPLFFVKWHHFEKEKMPDDSLQVFIRNNSKKLDILLPPAGSMVAYERLLSFEPNIDRYPQQRDFPSLCATSRLSIYLKNGSITPGLILARLLTNDPTLLDSANQFVKEIAWREFYYHILYHEPRVEHEAFLPQFRNISWQNNEKYFDAWKNARTGYPIVDAGMTQLNETGWLHNRVRMIVASFLTKDLLIDWRWGEKYFMNKLLDGDLASNNGGWQWAASTGCDPQPYFRVFNPGLQAHKFDPDGTYVRKWLPEGERRNLKPIVDHNVQRKIALRMYQDAKRS